MPLFGPIRFWCLSIPGTDLAQSSEMHVTYVFITEYLCERYCIGGAWPSRRKSREEAEVTGEGS